MPDHKNKNILGVICVVCLLMNLSLAACQPKPVLPTETPTATINPATATQTSTPTVTLTPTPLPPLGGMQTRYTINATIDYYNHFISATQSITYTNKSTTPFAELAVMVYPSQFENMFTLKTLTDANGASITNYRYEKNCIYITLPAPLQPAESITLNASYSLSLPFREGTLGYTGRAMNLANWYLMIPPYQDGSGWMVNDMWLVNSFIVGEHLSYESADFDVTLQFTDRRENLIIAAGAPALEDETGIHYQHNLARTFTISISDQFRVAEVQAGDVKVISYSFPETVPNNSNQAAAEIAAQSVVLYSEMFYPYPRPILSVVQADFLHGMEYDGLILLSRGFYDFYDGSMFTNLTIIGAHETCHQWFFSLVGNNQAIEPWLDESMATYCELLYYERYSPDSVNWWWNNRVLNHIPAGFIDSSIYFANGYEPYRDAVYLRGALFMDELRTAIGDEAFFGFLRHYVKTNAYEIATKTDFFSALSLFSSADISAILNKYFQYQ